MSNPSSSDEIALKVTLPFAQEAGTPFDPPLLVSATGPSFPANSDDLFLARIKPVQVDQNNVSQRKERTEMALEGNLEVGVTTELDGMLFFLFDQKEADASKPLQLARWTAGQSYRFAVQVFACRLKHQRQVDGWSKARLVGQVLTDEIASVTYRSIRRNPAMVSPDRMLSEAIAGMRTTNASVDVAEMKRRHPTRDFHPDAAKAPWRSMGSKE